MIYDFKCLNCGYKFEKTARPDDIALCPKCGKYSERRFHATSNIFIPAYFHTSKSDIFSDTEWQDLKKNPDIERA